MPKAILNGFLHRNWSGTEQLLIMHYWNDKGLLEETETGWIMKVALSPVMNYAELDTEAIDKGLGKGAIFYYPVSGSNWNQPYGRRDKK